MWTLRTKSLSDLLSLGLQLHSNVSVFFFFLSPSCITNPSHEGWEGGEEDEDRRIWHSEGDRGNGQQVRRTNERGTPEGEGERQLCGGRRLLSFLTCVGKTQDFWLLRLLRLWDIWDQRLFLSNVGDLI